MCVCVCTHMYACVCVCVCARSGTEKDTQTGPWGCEWRMFAHVLIRRRAVFLTSALGLAPCWTPGTRHMSRQPPSPEGLPM